MQQHLARLVAWLKKLGRCRPACRTEWRRRPEIESMEDRLVPSAVVPKPAVPLTHTAPALTAPVLPAVHPGAGHAVAEPDAVHGYKWRRPRPWEQPSTAAGAAVRPASFDYFLELDGIPGLKKGHPAPAHDQPKMAHPNHPLASEVLPPAAARQVAQPPTHEESSAAVPVRQLVSLGMAKLEAGSPPEKQQATTTSDPLGSGIHTGVGEPGQAGLADESLLGALGRFGRGGPPSPGGPSGLDALNDYYRRMGGHGLVGYGSYAADGRDSLERAFIMGDYGDEEDGSSWLAVDFGSSDAEYTQFFTSDTGVCRGDIPASGRDGDTFKTGGSWMQDGGGVHFFDSDGKQVVYFRWNGGTPNPNDDGTSEGINLTPGGVNQFNRALVRVQGIVNPNPLDDGTGRGLNLASGGVSQLNARTVRQQGAVNPNPMSDGGDGKGDGQAMKAAPSTKQAVFDPNPDPLAHR
jgi:hypothetical protein